MSGKYYVKNSMITFERKNIFVYFNFREKYLSYVKLAVDNINAAGIAQRVLSSTYVDFSNSIPFLCKNLTIPLLCIHKTLVI